MQHKTGLLTHSSLCAYVIHTDIIFRKHILSIQIEVSQIYVILLIKVVYISWNSKDTLGKWNKTLGCLFVINAWTDCDRGEIFFLWLIFFNELALFTNYIWKWYYIVLIPCWSILYSGKSFKQNISHLALPRWMFSSQPWLAVETDVRVCHGCFDSPVILIQGSDPCGLSIILLTLQQEQHSRHWTVNQ